MLDDAPYATVFGPASPAHYLTGTLEKKGELLVRYYAVAHEQLANGIALLSGQGPTPQTAQNCPTYENVTPGTVGAEGQVSGTGCVYPSATQTLAGQLTAKHLTWKAYLEGMDEGPGGAGIGVPPAANATDGACGHPALGAADPLSALTPPAGQAYATWRNPFVYFHSVIDSPSCASDDVGLSSLKGDLASAKSTPSFSYIVPGRCDDGDTTPCAAGQTARDGRGGRVPAEGRPGDPRIEGIQGKRPARDHRRRGALERRIRRFELLLRTADIPQPAGAGQRDRQAGRGTGRRAAAVAVRQGREPRSGRPTTTSRCCARSRTSSGSRTSATRARPGSARSARRCSRRPRSSSADEGTLRRPAH